MPQPLPTFIERDVPLAPRTTLEVGGTARYFLAGTDEARIRAGLAWAREAGVPVRVLGGGSNVLVADEGLAALVVQVALGGRSARRSGDVVVIEVAAGEVWDDVVAAAVADGLAGIECLSGIPGQVGAAPIQNIGAYGQEVAEVILGVRAFDRVRDEVVVLPPAACAFGYRTSAFKTDESGRYVVLGVSLTLRAGGAPALRYAELARRLAGTAPDLAATRAAVLALRRGKSMVIDAGDPNRRSAGSFFLNPVLAPAEAEAVTARAAAAGVDVGGMPRWPAGGGRVKLSAAWLIEQSGLARGAGEGPAGLSTRHTLAIVNRGGARAADLVRFAARVRRRVAHRFGVRLCPEPVFLGFDRPAEALLDEVATTLPDD